MIVTLIEKVYSFLWGDLVQIPLPGGSTLGISLLIILLIPTGIYFTVRTRFLPIRLFPDMVQALVEKKQEKNSLSSFQTLIVSTATRVGMGKGCGISKTTRMLAQKHDPIHYRHHNVTDDNIRNTICGYL